MWKWILGLIIAILVVLAGFRLADSGVPVEIATARRGGIEAWVDEQAVTRVPRTIVIAAPLSGRIQPLPVREGDHVRAGQAVASMATDDLARAVARAEARVAEAEAAIAENDDTSIEQLLLEQAQTFTEVVERARDAAEQQTRASAARHDLAIEERQRTEEALARASASELELLRARAEEIQTDAAARGDEITLRAVEAALVAARIGPQIVARWIERKSLTRQTLVQQRQAAVVELAQARADLERATIRAPEAGVILMADLHAERWVAAGAPLIELGRLDALEVEAEILTEHAAAIRPGQPAIFYGGALGDARIDAAVERIDPRGFEERSALGVQQQRVLVILRPAADPQSIAGAWGNLGVGYRVRVRITTARAADAVVVPRAALFPIEEGHALFMADGGRARRTGVATGLMNDDVAQITGGLAAGAEVIIAPPADLRDGDRIQPAH